MVKRYIQNCHICRCAKALRNQYNNLLKLLPIFSHPWINITLEFTIGLSVNNIFNAILIIIDHLIKNEY